MKSFFLTLSILQNTNRAISNSEEDWSAIIEGSYLKIEKDNCIFTIIKKSPFFYIEEFEVFQPNKIKINKNINAELLIGDIIDISYKQYEVSEILEIINPGINFRINDLISFNDKCVLNKQDNTNNEAIFRVKSIGPNGEIQSLKLESPGIFSELPEVLNIKNNACIRISTKRCSNHSALENEIINISRNGNESIITLGYNLPDNIKSGKLSCKKWEMYLDKNYVNDSKFDVKYEVLKDYTPNLKLAYLVKNSSNFEAFYNQNLNLIDTELKRLREELDKLKK